MNIKVLRIIARLNIGGPARNVVLLSEGLSHRAECIGERDSYETVLVCGEVDKSEGDMMYLAQQKGITPVIVKELGREISWRYDLIALQKIYRIICREKPDIVHTHTAKAGTLGRLAALLYNLTHSRCKIVHTFHGHVFQGYFGRIKTAFFIWIERILALFTDKIVTVSEGLRRELVYNFKIAPLGKISVIELGFELDGLLKLPLREDNGIVNIGIIGRLVPVKNHKMLFRIANSIRSQVGGIKLKFIVIGDGEMRKELEVYIEELGIADIIEFKGWVKDLCEIYRDLDIVVLTSLNEGTPVSIIEAMAAASPVVATAVGGVNDIVQDGKTGYLVRDEKAFKERLLDLIEDSEKRKQFGLCGRGVLAERFLKDRLVKYIDNLYRVLLKRCPAL